jgi:hypothetical protein
MVSELISSGCTPEAAARVVAQAFLAGVMSVGHVTSADESVTHRRESDRLRKQRSRDRLVTNRDVTGQSQDASLYKEEKIEEIKEEREAKSAASRLSRGQRLADDWFPTAQDLAVADELVGAHRARTELDKFRDHWKQQPGGKGVKLDWNAAWRNWIRRAAEFGAQRNGKTQNALSGFSGLGARLRETVAAEERNFGYPSAGQEPPDRR